MTDETKSPFSKGQAVQHKTGGPKMIYVGDTEMTRMAICTWMAGGHKQSESFDHAELQPYVEPVGWSGGTSRA